ncbi:MAG: hypothetical protein PHI37_05250 [Candidatus Gracilibacteria bacterium]|nr:hypothetical protein [Candidatus Gracilibacteria bacterium]
MYVDGIKGEEFDDINMADFSSDSSTVYYTDGNTRKYNNYSINGKYYFYCGKKDGKWYAIINGLKGEPFDGIYDGLVLHPSVGDEYSYIGISGKNKYLIKDGKKIDISFTDDIIYDSFQYIPNSNKIMFFASSNGKKYIVVDGIKGEEFDNLYISIQDFGIVGVYFSKDGNNYFYFGKKDGKWSLIKNTNKILTFDADYIENDFISSSNGEKYVFTFLKGNNTYYLVSNGIISDKNSKLIVKPVLDDFNNMAYVTKNNNVISLIINGKTIKTYGDEGEFYNIKYNSKDNSFVYFYYTLHWLSSNTFSKLEGVINYNLSTKKITEYKNTLNDLKVIDSFLGKYKVLPVEKKYKIEDKLNELIKNLKPGTKNYGVIYKLLQTIK